MGAMKSGTTSFYKYLIQHPEICEAKKKEPEFFSEKQKYGGSFVNYCDVWNFNSEYHKVALEASTGYTKFPLEQNVPRRMFEYGLKPKFVYCVRNPIDRIISHMSWDMVNKNGSHGAVSQQMLDTSNYYLQLEQFRKFFPKESFLLVDFDDISLNPQRAADQVFNFLGLPGVAIENVINHNKTPSVKQKILKQKYSKLSGILPGKIKSLVKIIVRRLYSNEKCSLPSSEVERIYSHLKSDMWRFQNDYNFDVGKWGF